LLSFLRLNFLTRDYVTVNDNQMNIFRGIKNEIDIFLEGLTQMLIAISFCFLLCCLTGFQFSLDWNFNFDGSVIVDNQSLHITNP